jgi:hypothetical protein
MQYSNFIPLAASTLFWKLSLAIPQAIIHHRAFLAFSESLRVNHAKEMADWEDQVTDWERNHNAYCPYDLPDQSELFSFPVLHRHIKTYSFTTSDHICGREAPIITTRI